MPDEPRDPFFPPKEMCGSGASPPALQPGTQPDVFLVPLGLAGCDPPMLDLSQNETGKVKTRGNLAAACSFRRLLALGHRKAAHGEAGTLPAAAPCPGELGKWARERPDPGNLPVLRARGRCQRCEDGACPFCTSPSPQTHQAPLLRAPLQHLISTAKHSLRAKLAGGSLSWHVASLAPCSAQCLFFIYIYYYYCFISPLFKIHHWF